MQIALYIGNCIRLLFDCKGYAMQYFVNISQNKKTCVRGKK